MKRLIFPLLSILTGTFFSCQQPPEPVRVIFDTDFGGDADDLGALAMLNHFHNRQEADLLAVMCWNLEQYSVSAVDAVNTFYGNPEIPIGLRSGDPHLTDWNHSKVIADHLPHDLIFAQAPEATDLYRKVLNGQPDSSVVIVTVGPLMNIKTLLESGPDKHSQLSGEQLVATKVKEFVIMGGNFPSGTNEWNFDGGMPGVTMDVLEQIPCPITYLGAELGSSIKTGEVFNELPNNSPLFLGFSHFSQFAPWMGDVYDGDISDNSTFDQTAVLYAVRNGVGTYWKRVPEGICVADSTGGNRWESSPGSRDSYLVLAKPVGEMEDELEKMMLGKFD